MMLQFEEGTVGLLQRVSSSVGLIEISAAWAKNSRTSHRVSGKNFSDMQRPFFKGFPLLRQISISIIVLGLYS
jgi:hypothetical protein